MYTCYIKHVVCNNDTLIHLFHNSADRVMISRVSRECSNAIQLYTAVRSWKHGYLPTGLLCNTKVRLLYFRQP